MVKSTPSEELDCCRLRGASPAEIAHLSTSWSSIPHAAELVIATPSDEAILLGAFQRSSEIDPFYASLPMYRRGSGGAAARIGPGTIWIRLALSRPDALVDATAPKLLNRYVRPLLRALTKSGAHAHYFDRDWISVAHRPVGLVGFAHDMRSGRASFEAIIAVTTPFAPSARASFLEKEPATIAELKSRSDVEHIADAIEEAYCSLALATTITSPARTPAPRVLSNRPWTATLEEALGTIAAGRDENGVLRLGGELMASRDAVERLENRLASAPAVDVGEAVDEAFAPPAVIFGVRSLVSIRDVVLSARDA